MDLAINWCMECFNCSAQIEKNCRIWDPPFFDHESAILNFRADGIEAASGSSMSHVELIFTAFFALQSVRLTIYVWLSREMSDCVHCHSSRWNCHENRKCCGWQLTVDSLQWHHGSKINSGNWFAFANFLPIEQFHSQFTT